MVRVISQETYNEVVKENIQEFDMTPEEAIKEAVAQFEAQGVDLSNIIKDLNLGSGDHLISQTIKKLKDFVGKKDNDNLIINELIILKTECSKDIAHRVKAGKEGAYEILIKILEDARECTANTNQAEFTIRVLDTLTTLMDSQPDLLDSKGVDLIIGLLSDVQNEELLIATLKWTSICCIKHEINRQKLFSNNIGNNLKSLLKKTPRALSETLQVIRKLTLDDDIRVEFGKAHEHARDMGVLMLETLTKLMQENTKPPLVSEIMSTIATLLVRHELCSVVAENGVQTLFTILIDNYDNVSVSQQANKLITALAGNDDVKRQMVKGGIVPVIVSLLSRHSSNSNATAITLKCIAALTLREPEHSGQFLESGAPEAIVECMKIHPNNAAVQKNACWAIRNMVARCRDHNSKFHELGVEAILNKSSEKFEQDFGFDIKSALRDLECDVKLDEQWTGKGGEIEK